MRVERADFDDLVTLVTQAPTWEKERLPGIRVLLRAIAEGKPDAPDQILARWTWRLARATRKVQDRRASTEFPEAKRLLGALANSRGHRHEENAAKLVKTAREQPIHIGAALLASAEGYTPRANKLIDEARERARHRAGGRARALREPARAEAAAEQAPPAPAQEEDAGADRGRERRRPQRARRRATRPTAREPREAEEAAARRKPKPARKPRCDRSGRAARRSGSRQVDRARSRPKTTQT